MATPLNEYVGGSGARNQNRVANTLQYQVFRLVKGAFMLLGITIKGLINVIRMGVSQVFNR